jgi:A/G-specific adenine glycosylase
VPDPELLLDWYDRHRRELPWRTKAGEGSNPYCVWISEIMLQQTRVETVLRYYGRFLQRFPTVHKLAKARLNDVLKAWAGLGYYARARNLHACARAVVKKYGGRFPETEAELRALPGIGSYTAAAIAAIAFGKKATPVDGNIERVVARLFRVEARLPGAKPELQQFVSLLVPKHRPGDFVQAMMDLGSIICTPKNPSCLLCPWSGDCAAYRATDPETYPRRVPKTEGKLRRGAAFVVLRADGTVLLRERPKCGLLGSMTEVPTTKWSVDFDEKSALKSAPLKSKWHRVPGFVRHVFTHFPLELGVYVTEAAKTTRAPSDGRFVRIENLESEALPSLMRKVITQATDGIWLKEKV